jgi:hypothetical protein
MPPHYSSKAVRGPTLESPRWRSEMLRQHRGKTVTKPFGLTPLELPLSEKQIPQVVEKVESGGKPKEALEAETMRPRQVRYLVLECPIIAVWSTAGEKLALLPLSGGALFPKRSEPRQRFDRSDRHAVQASPRKPGWSANPSKPSS